MAGGNEVTMARLPDTIGYGAAREVRSRAVLNRRQFALFLVPGLAVAVSACGRRGALEPPPYTEQGRQWEQRTARSPNRVGAQQPQGSVRTAVQQADDTRGTRDIDGELEERRTEGEARVPSDPTQGAPVTPAVTPTGGTGRRRPPGIIPPNRSFVLDALLD